MFVTTFLGHQGWLLRSGPSCILVDPLLVEDFGDIHALDYRVYPPREFGPESLPAVDAVILSHEHDDHFDIPSLARIDRRVPVYMSGHSSVAAFAILRQMGFAAHPLVPGVPLTFGALQVIPFSGDHLSVNCADEWDALPYLVRDVGGAGSFFSSVDVALDANHIRWAKAYAPRPGLVTWSNNAVDWSHMFEAPARNVGTEQCYMSMGGGHQMILKDWGKPAAMLICAGGFTFHGERSWFNQRVFWVDTEAVCAKLASLYRDERFFSAIPGQTFTMENNALVKVEARAPFLGTAPRSTWPTRGRTVRPNTPDYAPATGRRDLRPGDDALLRARLRQLAVAMVGGILFRSLHSILAVESGARKLTFALVLRQGDDGVRQVFEYDASACDFVPGGDADPRDAYVAGWECWATDMLAVLNGEIGPISLMFGRARLWNALPERLRFDLLEALTRVSHPLSSPAEYLRIYEQMWARQKDVVPTVVANTAV